MVKRRVIRLSPIDHIVLFMLVGGLLFCVFIEPISDITNNINIWIKKL